MSSLIKANYVKYGKSDKRVIDSNQAVIDRLQLLNTILESEYSEDDFADEFVEGIDAQAVDALLVDNEQEEEVKVIAKEQIDGMLADAQGQADDIIASANDEAARIIEAARQEAQALKEQGYNEGFEKGSEAGYQEGAAKTAQMEEELNAQMLALNEQYEQMVSELEPTFVKLLTDIYSHVFTIDLSDKTGVVLHLLRNAIRNVETTTGYFVHVSNEDYEYVAAHKQELSTGLASTCVVEIIEDVSLKEGECFIEADSGIFDCSLDIELNNLKKELMLLSYTPSQE